MKNIKIAKVTEYGIVKKHKMIPDYYDFNYCISKGIPFIKATPKIKYSIIEFDLFSINSGLIFNNGDTFQDYWNEFYDNYILNENFSKDKILFQSSHRTARFRIFKKDQDKILELVKEKIEEFANKFGVIDPDEKRRFDEIERINKRNNLVSI